MKDNSTEILFQSFLQETILSSSSMGRDVHSMILSDLSIQYFLCWPRHSPPSQVPWRVVLERLSWRMTYPHHASFCLLTAARTSSCGPTRKASSPRSKPDSGHRPLYDWSKLGKKSLTPVFFPPPIPPPPNNSVIVCVCVCVCVCVSVCLSVCKHSYLLACVHFIMFFNNRLAF